LITHRPSAIGITTKLLLMRDGGVHMFGPTAQVLAALQEANAKAMAAQQQLQAQQAGAKAPATSGETNQ
jgi:ATP-binding cassette subfamily C exporter for protease/lipase